MDMKQPATPNPIDDNRHGWIGKPLDRVDGPIKVAGEATYAYEYKVANLAYGYILEAGIATGRIARFDTSAAESAPGVIHVMTYLNAPKQAAFDGQSNQRFARPKPYLEDDRVRHYGEPVALVVAESFEQARAAAQLIEVEYAADDGAYLLRGHLDRGAKPEGGDSPPDTFLGDFDAAFAAAPHQVDATYTTPVHIHAQMEPHAALAMWEGDRVSIYCAAQLLEDAQSCVASTLQIPRENVRIVSRYIGGGFGGKLPIYADTLLAAMAARELGRPVKVALTRQQMFHITTHRSDTVQRVRLGADADGRLLAIGHDNWSHTARYDNYYETSGKQTRSLYAAANRRVTHRQVKLDLPESSSCRAPGEAVGMLALESAMDELAVQLNLDPIELRVRNEPSQDPEKHVPFSTRQLIPCMRAGAERFGWDKRNPVPGQVRDGDWLVGMGMSAASRSNLLKASQCEVRVNPDGSLTAKMAMTDIGTGSYTVLTQIAAELLGLPEDKIVMLLGDSDYPPTPGSGGSFGAASAGSGLYDACMNLRAVIARAAGRDPARARFADGKVDGISFASLAQRQELAASGEIEPGDMAKKYSQQAYGAFFAEVGVDRFTGEIRLRRMLGVFAAGRILNQKTAQSQALGGMIWGIGSALMEEAVVDPQFGFFANHDLAEYHVPAHADVPAIEALYLPEVDDKANPLKIKGVGELGICGAGAALANAVYNACGVRIRDYPLTLDKVLAGMLKA
jgi:xanthine dehydrogenase YagR molybdenum-binding subunit